MIYDVRQMTAYTYASPVTYARHVLRLTPIDRPRQRVHVAALDILPTPVRRREGFDYFGNRLTWIELNQPHDKLAVHVMARVAVDHRDDCDPLASPSWESVRDEMFAIADIRPTAPGHFLFPSRQVSLDSDIRDYARESFSPGRPILDAAVELGWRIKTDLTYEIGATTASTTPSMSFALRRGVCQDFAHIMIAGLRGLGLPAAYVSGYLRTSHGPERPRLEGANAMHAWVNVWCGADIGWYGLDPTNAVAACNNHVVLAIGRDYADVAPVDGVILASGGQHIDVVVSVVPC
jgi:transglutaminase-like putative cysteine protease